MFETRLGEQSPIGRQGSRRKPRLHSGLEMVPDRQLTAERSLSFNARTMIQNAESVNRFAVTAYRKVRYAGPTTNAGYGTGDQTGPESEVQLRTHRVVLPDAVLRFDEIDHALNLRPTQYTLPSLFCVLMAALPQMSENVSAKSLAAMGSKPFTSHQSPYAS